MCSKCGTNKCCQTTSCVAPCVPCMDDCLAQKVECVWKQAFCDAKILPQIGYPSCANGVMTLTHSIGCTKIKINGLCIQSMLANNAFFSSEVSCGKWVNLYQVNIPNVPGKCGCKSSGEVYIEALVKLGISVSTDGYNWKGSCPSMLTFRSMAIGMDPCEFSKKSIAAVKAVLEHFSCDIPCC